MLLSKEIQEQMTNKIVDISLERVKKPQMVKAIIHKWRKLGTAVDLPRSGRPSKIAPRAQRRLIQEVIKEPRTSSKELQASIKVSIHDSDKNETGQKRHPWESSKAKATADQKEHKGLSHIC